ncbi:MAG: hydroxymethylbilane synthase, partial [Nocardioides sp.]
LAYAGLKRLGLGHLPKSLIDPIECPPAPGQGALAVECRADRADVGEAAAALDDPDSRAAVTAERALLAVLEAGCSAPIGALAEVAEGEDGLELSLRAYVGASDGSADLRRSLVGLVEDPEHLGKRLAAVLLEDGAADLVTSLSPVPPTLFDDARPPEDVVGSAPSPTPPHNREPAP